MKLELSYVQNLLSTQDYLTFDLLLTEMYTSIKEKKDIIILSKTESVVSTLTSLEEIETWKKYMIEIYGLFGLI